MPRSTTALLYFFWCCSVAHAQKAPTLEESAMYSLAVHDRPVENGKMLDMSFRELTRETEQSLVEVTRVSGGSVSSSLFIVRGMCGLMRARSKQNFVSEEVPKQIDQAAQTEQYRVTFPHLSEAIATPSRKQLAFSAAQCSLFGFNETD